MLWLLTTLYAKNNTIYTKKESNIIHMSDKKT